MKIIHKSIIQLIQYPQKCYNLHTDYNLAADYNPHMDYVPYADYNPNTEYNLHTNYETEFMNSQIHVVMCLPVQIHIFT